MTTPLLRRLAAADVTGSPAAAIDPQVRATAAGIVKDVRTGGDAALRRHARDLDGLADDEPLVHGRAALAAALAAVPPEVRALLERTAARIGAFAAAQRRALADIEVPVPGGAAGHRAVPLAAAGCYAPGGRHPLPSSVLMTAVTARVAGVGTV
ncbi:MAG: histidinol dehydrogenase, partial [Candidatus Krumholzibacteriia bacterium]